MKKMYRFRYVMSFLLAMLMLTGCFGCAQAAADPLKPDDLSYDNGNIILHKQAERISEDEWEVTVRATIDDSPVEKPQIEVVFVLDVSSTMNACAVMEQHNSFYNGGGTIHTHTADCPAGCTATVHMHVSGSPGSSGGCYMMGANGIVYYERRISVARSAINDLVDGLPADTTIKYAYFSTNAGITTSYDALGQYDIQGQTYIMKGVDLGVDQFTNTGKTQIMILVTDGQATDNLYTSTKFENFRNNGGVVFTVGFNHDDPNLRGMTANGGSYFTATNPGDLTEAFDTIQGEITAMLKDPMGSSVGFDVTSITSPANSVSGKVTHTEDTIYWTPSTGTQFSDATIEYSYKVALNDSASMDAGRMQVPLNKPTSLLYGIKNGEVVDMKDAAFPIPEATYSIASVQVNWKYGSTDIQTPTETETIINDFGTPAFETDYTTITQLIPASGNNKYRYTGTTITRNGAVVDAVDPADPAAFVVTHNYELTEAYNITYKYTGTVPDGAPVASLNNTTGKPGETIIVADDPQLKGWQFSGWTVAAGNATVENGQFSMPANDVELVGSWVEKNNTYAVEAVYYTSVDGRHPYQPDNETPEVLVARTETEEDSITYDFSDNYTFNGNTYTSVQLAQDSHGQLEGDTVVAGFEDETDLTIKLAFYREILSDAKYTVTHQYFVTDPDGNVTETDDTFTTEEITGKHGEVVATSDIEAVTIGTSGKQYEETTRTEDITLTKDEVKNITVSYMRYEYRVEVEGDTGVDTTSGAGTYEKGTDVVTGYTLKEGYDLLRVTVDGEDKTNDASALIFNTIDANHKVVIETQKSDAKYTVTHAYFVTDPDGNVTETDDTFTTEEITGKHGDVVAASDIEAVTTGTSGKQYEETARTEDVILTKDEVKNITINYMRYEYRVEVEGDEGVDTTSGAGTYEKGTDVVTGYRLKDGYDLLRVTVDGEDKTDDASALIFNTIDANHEVYIETQKSEASYTVTHQYFVTDPDGNVTETDDTFTTAAIGGEHGDVITAESITSQPIGTSGKQYEETARTEDITLTKDEVKNITVSYMRYEYRVEVEGDTGVDTTSGAGTYEKGTDVVTGYSLKEGYDLLRVTVDGEDKTNDASALIFNTIDANHEVYIETQKSEASYTVTHQYFVTDPDGNVTETDDTFTTAAIGGKHGDVITAESITSQPIGTSGKQYEETARTEDIILTKEEVKNITVSYMRYEYRVEVEGDTGVDTTSGAGTYEKGTDVVTGYSLKEGYDLLRVTVDGEDKTNDASALIFNTIDANHKVVIITRKQQVILTAKAIVHYVDEDGNPLREDTTTDEIEVGTPYDVSEALTVQSIQLNGREYRFIQHFLTKSARGLQGTMIPTDSDYAGLMPEYGVEITRVYKLVEEEKVSYYYQQKYVYTVYAADGTIVYSGMDEWPVTVTEDETVTVTAPEAYHRGEYDYLRVSGESQTADLTDTTEERPYVFVTLYEVRLTEEPEVEEEPVVPDLPPQTGDDGVMLWAVLMLCSIAGLALLTVVRRRQEDR